MLRRSIFELSRRGCIRRIPRQIPAYLSSTKAFSSTSHQNASEGPGSKGNPTESDDKWSKLDVASVVVGVSVLTANQLGYFDELLGKEQNFWLKYGKIGINNNEDLKYVRYLGEPLVLPNGDEHNRLSRDVSLDKQKSSTQADVLHMAAPVSKMNDAYISEDGKLVLDFFKAIHAAEKRQDELDAHVFGEQKKMLKEKNARARQLMSAEEAAILYKELNRAAKATAAAATAAAAAMKSLQEKAEDKLKMELEREELEVKKIQELAKAGTGRSYCQ